MKRHDRMDATNSMGNAVELYFVDTLEGTAVFLGGWLEDIALFFSRRRCAILPLYSDG